MNRNHSFSFNTEIEGFGEISVSACVAYLDRGGSLPLLDMYMSRTFPSFEELGFSSREEMNRDLEARARKEFRTNVFPDLQRGA